MSVLDNVAYGLKVKKVGRSERAQKAREALEMVRLPDVGGRKPAQLSGGQRQRVALARAIVNRPRVLLLDEPLGALDLKLREEMQVELKRIQQEVGITFVYVTHDQDEALSMSDRLAVFNRGRIEQVGTPAEVYEHPAGEFVAGFVGASNVLERDGRRFTIRPEKVRLLARTTPPRASSPSPARSSTRATPARRRATRSRSTPAARSPSPARTSRRPTTRPADLRGRQVRVGWRVAQTFDIGQSSAHPPRRSEHEAHHARPRSRPCPCCSASPRAAATTTAAAVRPAAPGSRSRAARSSRRSAPARAQLNLIVWAGYAEDGSTDPKVDWVTPFEKSTGCKVNAKTPTPPTRW